MTEKEAEMNEFYESTDKLLRTLSFFPCADTEH